MRRSLRVVAASVALLCAVEAVSNDSVTLSFFGDSLTSCHGVSQNQQFAFLSFRESLWHDHIAKHFSQGSVLFVGKRRGCNSQIDKLMPRASEFPNFHDSYFGRTSKSLLRELPACDECQASNSSRFGMISVVMIGTNDFTSLGKANASEVLANIVQIVGRLRCCGSQYVVVAVPPNVDFNRIRTSHRKARKDRWLSYIESLRGGIVSGLDVWHNGTVDLSDVNVFNASRHTADGLHPNHDGERRIALAMFRVLRGLIISQLDGRATNRGHREVEAGRTTATPYPSPAETTTATIATSDVAAAQSSFPDVPIIWTGGALVLVALRCLLRKFRYLAT